MKQKLLNSLRLQLCTLVACLLCAFNGQAWGETVTDVIDNAATSSALSNTGSTSWATDFTLTGASGAEYKIHSMGTKNSTEIALQWNKNGYLYAKKSGGILKSVKITTTTNAGTKSISVYAANTAYSAQASGTAINTLSAKTDGGTYEFTDNYTFIALNGTTSSTSIKTIEIVWEVPSASAVATTTTIDHTGITNTDVYAGTAAGSLSASVTADGTAVEGATVTWSSSETNVATIDANGAVTLVAAGTTTITASYAGVTDQYQASSTTYELTVTNSAPIEEFVFSELDYENAADVTSVEGTDVTLTFAAGSNTQNSPKYYTSGYGVRMYNGNTLTIASTKKIAQIEFTFDGSYNTLALATGQAGTLSDAANSMRTWTGSATSVIFTTSATNRIKTIKVTYESEDLQDPELSYSTTEYTVEAGAAFTTPTLTNPHDLTVTYSSSNTDLATVDENTGAVTIGSTPGTVTITASFAGNDTYSYGSASYTIKVSTVLANIAALTALENADDYQVHLTNALVTYIHGNNAYLEDASGAVLLFGCAEGLAVGDKINGTADVTYTVYHSLPEVTAITLHEGYTKTSGNTVTPSEVTIAELNENFTSYISRYVKIVEATVTSAFANRSAEIKQDEASIALRDQNSEATLTATVDDIVTVTAHPAIYNTTKQIAVYEQSQIVVKPIEKIDPTILVEDASIEFGSSYTIDTDLIEGGDVTATSGTTAVATVNGLVITPIAVGSTVITVTTAENNRYNAGSETFTLTVTQPAGQTTAPTATTGEVMFYEPFTSCEGSGGNDDAWSGSIAAKDFTSDNEGWTHVKGSSANECAKFGAGSSKGSATTPTIAFNDANATYTLTFKAGAWSGDKTEDALTLSCSDANARFSASTFTLSDGAWSDYTVTITGVSSSATLTFSAVQNSKNRFFLDEVKIEAPASAVPTISYTIPSSGVGTYCNEYPLDLSATALPSDVKAYAVESQTETSVTLEEITSPVKGGTGIIIKATGETKTVNFTSVDCATAPEGNKLIGTLAPTYVAANTVYGMKSGEFHPNNAGTIPANRAYLPAEEGTPVKALTLIFKDADGITETRTITDAQTIYDLTGRRLQNMQKGVNIVGGKKVLVK